MKAVLAFCLLFFALSEAHAAPVIERFPNGLTLVTEHRPGASVTAVQVWVRAGSIDEQERTLGLSHFLEHMLFKGTTTRPVGSIHGEVEKNGGEINAATSDDWTYYHITIGSNEWQRALDIILDIAHNATFPDTEVELEREVIKEEIARRDDNPTALLYDNLGRAAYRVHPYRWRVIGDSESLANIKRQVFVDYYRRHYIPQKMAVVIVGEFDSEIVHDSVAATLGRLPKVSRRFASPAVEPPTVPRHLEVSANTVRTYGAVSYPAPAGRDLRSNAAGDLLIEILAGAGGRLTKAIVESSRLADAVGISFPTARDPSRYSVTYVASPANRVLIENEIKKEIRKLAMDGITANEVFTAIDKNRRDRKLSNESSSSSAFQYGFWFTIGRPELSDDYDRTIESITPADINAFIRKYLNEKHVVTVAVEPKAVPAAALVDSNIVIRRTSSDLVSVGLFFPGGQSTEPEPGWSAFLAGVMNRGVEGKTQEEHQRYLAALGISISASSSADVLSVIGTSDPDRVGLLVDELFRVLTNPNIDDIEIVREQILAAIKSRGDRPFDVALDKLAALRFGNHPYGRPELGDAESVKAATGDELLKYLGEIVSRGTIKVVAVGNVVDTPLSFALGENLAALKEPSALPPVEEPGAFIASSVSETALTAQTIVLRSITAPAIGHDSYPAWKVANAILGGRSSSRLFRIVREERGLAYSVGSFYPTRALPSHLVLYAGTRPATARQVRELFGEALYPPSPLELDEARRLIVGEFLLDHELTARQAWYLGWYSVLGLGAQFDEAYPEKIGAVALKDVEAIFDSLRTSPAIDLTYGAAPE